MDKTGIFAMPRRIKSANLDTRTARDKLAVRGKPYWQLLDRELHLGYRKGKRGGQWVRRIYIGNQQYDTATFAMADDRSDANGVSILDWAQAQQKARELRDTFKRQEAGIEEPEAPYTVEQAVEDYIADRLANKGESAARDAQGRLRKHLLPKLGHKVLADLTTAELTKWRNDMVRVAQDPEDEAEVERERRSRDTANRVRSNAWAAFNLAFKNKKVTDDGEWRRVGPFEDVGEPRKIFLTEKEQQKLIDACEPGLREFALLVALTGARPGKEVTEARVRDLDLDQGTLNVKSNKGRGGRVRYRDIYLDDDAMALLRRLASGKRPNEHLLTMADGTPWRKSVHTRRVAAAVENAGLDPATNLYALRHSYISQALKGGVPTKAVGDQCGTSARMIEKHYAKFIPSDLTRYAKAAAPKLRYEPNEKVLQLKTVGK
ncbi:MAG: tyrosine-type recombinase/integrase [Pseudomonadota bacterium]